MTDFTFLTRSEQMATHLRGELVADDRVAEIVGFAVNQARLEAAAGDQGGEAVGVVGAAVGFLHLAVLAEGGAAELAAPDDDGSKVGIDDHRMRPV